MVFLAPVFAVRQATCFFNLPFSQQMNGMRKFAGLIFLLTGITTFSQDTTGHLESKARKEPDYIWVFSSPRLINANTVEMTPRGILEFKVTHNFGDIAGKFGGIKNFFGLDGATDVRIGFQYGLSKRFNIIAARAKGAATVKQLYELGLKYRVMQQANDSRHPLSVTLFANTVVSTMTANQVAAQDNSYDNFSDRLSQVLQLNIARKFGQLSFQVSPTLVHTNYTVPFDDKSIFALGGALRLPVKGKFSLLLDYFHSFRNGQSIDSFKTRDIRFYDALGVGIEFLTAGHVFHLNFTNATEIMENRFIPRTTTSWGKGQYRWGFTVARDFDMLWKKRNRKK